MANVLVRLAVRSSFGLTSRRAALRGIRRALESYLHLAGRVDADEGRIPIRVSRMPGVDEDMREWSLYMILQHNTIVNRSIRAIVEALVRGEAPGGAGAINPKTDVMPGPDADERQVDAFRHSVLEYVERVPALGAMRGTRVQRHPVFGELDAHQWHCMFGFHLRLHLRQARQVVQRIRSGPPFRASPRPGGA